MEEVPPVGCPGKEISAPPWRRCDAPETVLALLVKTTSQLALVLAPGSPSDTLGSFLHRQSLFSPSLGLDGTYSGGG